MLGPVPSWFLKHQEDNDDMVSITTTKTLRSPALTIESIAYLYGILFVFETGTLYGELADFELTVL